MTIAYAEILKSSADASQLNSANFLIILFLVLSFWSSSTSRCFLYVRDLSKLTPFCFGRVRAKSPFYIVPIDPSYEGNLRACLTFFESFGLSSKYDVISVTEVYSLNKPPSGLFTRYKNIIPDVLKKTWFKNLDLLLYNSIVYVLWIIRFYLIMFISSILTILHSTIYTTVKVLWFSSHTFWLLVYLPYNIFCSIP